MKLIYGGPSQAVEVPEVPGLVAKRGAAVDVPDEIAGHEPKPATGTPGEKGYVPADPGAGLLAQSIWTEAPTPPAPATATTTPKQEK